MNKFLNNIARPLAFIGVLALSLMGPLSRANAYQALPLPEVNLVKNPWFRSAEEPTLSGLDGWTDSAGKGKYWSTSQKASNPSPDVVVSGVCSNEEKFCGTAARLKNTPGQSGGVGVLGEDSYLTQVVAANPVNKQLFFISYWVSHDIDPAEVNIYGGDSYNGPWDFLWKPFYHVEDSSDGTPDVYTNTGLLAKEINRGYSFYKIEIHARLPNSESVGFKITGIYFTALGPGDPIPPVAGEMNYLPLVLGKKSK